MLHLCNKCQQPILDQQRVCVWISSTYHALKSTVSYALDKHDLAADSSTLQHERCKQPCGD